MTYRVALDDKQGESKGRMIESWYEPSGLYGIPSAMIVNKQGILAWIGYASEITNQLVEAVMSDTFDLQRSKRECLKTITESEIERKFYNALKTKDWVAAKASIADVRKGGDTNAVWYEISLLVAQRDYKAAVAMVEKQYPSINSLKRSEDAAQSFNSIAWAIASDEAASSEDFAFGEKVIARSIALTETNEGEFLDTLARLQFRSGKRDVAIQTEEKALKMVSEEDRPQLQKALEAYRKGELPKD